MICCITNLFKGEIGLKLSINFSCISRVILPLSYNHAIQSTIFNLISKVFPNVHDVAPVAKKRQFRPFVFSRLNSNAYQIKNGYISFDPLINLKIASPNDQIIRVLANELLKTPHINLNGNSLTLENLKVTSPEPQSNSIVVKTLSPVTIHSTLTSNEGKKKTYYYSPNESDFSSQIKANLLRKSEAIGVKIENNETFEIKAIMKPKHRTINYKGFIVVAWDADFKINGDKELLKLALNWGIGARNAQGFGMIEEVKVNH